MPAATGPAPFGGNNQQFASFAAANGALPSPQEGPRILPLNIDFTQFQSYIIDMKLAQQQAKMSFVQTIFVDNSQNLSPFTMQSQQTGQNIVIPPNAQGFVTVLSLVTPVFQVTSLGNVVVPIFLLNFPVSPEVWSTINASFNFNSSGYLKTNDVVLDALVGNWNSFGNSLAVADLGLQSLISNIGGAGNALDVNVLTGGGGGGATNIGVNAQLQLGLSSANIYTPPSGKQFVLYGVEVSVGPLCFASGGTSQAVNVFIEDGSSLVLFECEVWLPGTKPTPTVITPALNLMRLVDINYTSALANNVLKVVTSTTIGDSNAGSAIYVNALVSHN